jgi:hypothetical protein
MGMDVANNKYEYPGISEDETVNEVRKSMTKCVAIAGFDKVGVFLIDNHFPLHYDFPILMGTIISEAPTWKQEAMTLKVSGKHSTYIF